MSTKVASSSHSKLSSSNLAKSRRSVRPSRHVARPTRPAHRAKHQTLPKLPTNPLHHLGAMKQNKMGQMKQTKSANTKSIFLPPKRLAFHSALPELKLNPISYFIASAEDSETVLSQFSNYHTSHLEIDYKHVIETERDLGIKIDLNQYLLNAVFKDSDKPEEKNGPLAPELDEEDQALLSMDTGADVFNAQRRELLNTQETWLRRSKYMDVRDHQTARLNIGVPKLAPEYIMKTQEELRSDVQNTFNVSIPDVHPSKVDVVPEMIFDFVPNFDIWGLDYARVSFDTNPLPSSMFEGKDEDAKQGMLLALGNRLYRGGILDRNLCKENFTMEAELDYMLPPSNLKEKAYEVDTEVEYQFIRSYTLKAIHNVDLLSQQKFISASGKRNIANGYFVSFDPETQRANYCKIANEVQVRKKIDLKQGPAHSYDEKPVVFVRGRELTNAEKEEIEGRRAILEPDMESDLF